MTELLRPLAERRTDEVVITCMSVVRPWGRLSDHELDFASADSAMGHTADLALGVAMAQPSRRVVCFNGDGSMLMSLGTLATIVESGARNLTLFVVRNQTYEITGNQAVPAAGALDFCTIAKGAGFDRVHHFEDARTYAAALSDVLTEPGPSLVSVAVTPGSEGPISRKASEPARYLQTSLRAGAHRLRAALTERRG